MKIVNHVQVVSTVDELSRYVYVIFYLSRSKVFNLYIFLYADIMTKEALRLGATMAAFAPRPLQRAKVKVVWRRLQSATHPLSGHLASQLLMGQKKKEKGVFQHCHHHSVARWYPEASTTSLSNLFGVFFTSPCSGHRCCPIGTS